MPLKSTIAACAGAAVAALCLSAEPTEAVGVLAKMQGATDAGHSCDDACVRELFQLQQKQHTDKSSKSSKKLHGAAPTRGADEPLILTDLLKNGTAISDIQEQSKVSPQIGNHTSYSGFFTTDSSPEADNNMFFWYLPSQNGDASAPTLIWLQGGPGGSSLFGMFVEMGPFNVDADFNLIANPYTWNDKYNMLFIDNPVGAGFSYTGTGKGYVTNQDEVADNLYSLLQQFYQVFPDVLKTDLYVTGESYGGHYVPSISYKIHQENAAIAAGTAEESTDYGAPVTIPLKGLAVGDGWIDPVVQITGYPDMMFNLGKRAYLVPRQWRHRCLHVSPSLTGCVFACLCCCLTCSTYSTPGLADQKQQAVIQDYCDRAVSFIQEGEMLDAFNVWDEMLNGDVYPYVARANPHSTFAGCPCALTPPLSASLQVPQLLPQHHRKQRLRQHPPHQRARSLGPLRRLPQLGRHPLRHPRRRRPVRRQCQRLRAQLARGLPPDHGAAP